MSDECYFGETKREDETYTCLNPGCGRVMRGPFEPWQFHAPCRSGKPARRRPGTELQRLTAELGIKPKSGCDCAAVARWMDQLGVEGCLTHRAEILARLAENYEHYTLRDKLSAAVMAVTSGVALRLSIIDPLGSMLDEAIRRAADR